MHTNRSNMKAKPVNVKNLRVGENMTLYAENPDKKGGYDGQPMKFRALAYPFIYVSVDIYSKGSYAYSTSYDLREKTVIRLTPNACGKKQ